MSLPIDFTAKTDRELLLLTAQATNDLKDDIKILCCQIDDKADKTVVYWLGGVAASIILGMLGYVLKHIGFPTQ